MQDLINYLIPFSPVMKSAQYAYGGNWENAVAVDLDNPSTDEIGGRVDSTIAVEFFYKLSDSRMVFLGLRYSPKLKLAADPTEFILSVLRATPQAKKVSFEAFFALIGRELNDDALTYISRPIEYVELGVEDFWKSEGSLVLRKTSEPKLNRDGLEKLLKGHNSLIQNTKNHTALEFAVGNPEAWVGVQVSRYDGNNYKTDIDSLLNLANLI